MNLLVTGGCGFIGSNFVRKYNYSPEVKKLLVIDSLTYAADLSNIKDLIGGKLVFVKADIRNRSEVESHMSDHKITHVLHCAAESHVDNSIEGPEVFINTNVNGTFNLLEASRKLGIKRFVHVSTDEVYGSMTLFNGNLARTNSTLNPSSPYAASKAAADMLCISYARTYGLSTVITRCVNNYGPYQHREKLIPKTIWLASKNMQIPVYGDGSNRRDWIHVIGHCESLWQALHVDADGGSIYNIAGGHETSNIELVTMILKLMSKPESLVSFVEDRKGHDFRYAVLQTSPLPITRIDFEQGILLTISWYLNRFASVQCTSEART